MNMHFIRKLPIPKEVKAMFPLTDAMAAMKKNRDEKIKAVFNGESDLFLLIIGPCSADREDAVLEYMRRLRKLQEEVKDKIFIIPRLYTGKPRSSGCGYMGLMHQPDPKAAPNPYEGIISTRKFHIKVLEETGFTCADEMLYPENHRYLSDLLSYAAVGARSSENQQHRLTAGGLAIPVGFKNPTGGNLNVVIQAVQSARQPHRFLYRGWDVESEGNPLAHAVLRGYTDMAGHYRSNYHYEDLEEIIRLFEKDKIDCPSVIVDTNHANSGKDPEQQCRIAIDVMHSRKSNGEIKKTVKGLMIESYLEDGCQSAGGDCFGQSITDPCLGWEKSAALVKNIASQL